MGDKLTLTCLEADTLLMNGKWELERGVTDVEAGYLRRVWSLGNFRLSTTRNFDHCTHTLWTETEVDE